MLVMVPVKLVRLQGPFCGTFMSPPVSVSGATVLSIEKTEF